MKWTFSTVSEFMLKIRLRLRIQLFDQKITAQSMGLGLVFSVKFRSAWQFHIRDVI